MFEFLTKKGRAAIAERKRVCFEAERKQNILRERQAYEMDLSTYPKFNQAYYWLDSFRKYHLYSTKEVINLDVYYLVQMIEALDDSTKEIDILALTEEKPIQVFAKKVSGFMVDMLDVLCEYDEIKLAYNTESQLRQAQAEYSSVNPEYIEYILHWAIDHNVVKASMFLYEYLKWRGKCDEANQIKVEAESKRYTPWFWVTLNHYQPVDLDSDDTTRFEKVHSGSDYEEFIKCKLEQVNIVCDRTGGAGDQGVDILVYGNPRVAIQCKFYSHAIDNSAVQQVYAGMHYYDCGKAIVVSNAEFTNGARQLAKKLGVTLCHHKSILSELKEYGCISDDFDDMTPMGTMRGIRDLTLRHPDVLV